MTGSVKVMQLRSRARRRRSDQPASASKQQIEGGVIMGIGQALTEQLLRDKATGVPLNPNMLDYKVLSIKDMRRTT